MTIHDLTIEQMREIVDWAPDDTATHVAVCKQNHYYRLDNGHEQTYWNDDFKGWMDSSIEVSWEFFYNFKFAYVIDDLRTAIAGFDKASTKYDWSNVPDAIKWIATDADGFKVWFLNEPKKLELFWSDVGAGFYTCIKPEDNEYKGDWAQSLEKRPKEIKAGRRLDDTTDHCSDIRNHLSPNTKVIDHG